MYSFLTINFFELLAAMAGSLYLKSNNKIEVKIFVWFLWFSFINELVFGWLPSFVRDYDTFAFLKDTIFEFNLWIYNVVIIVKFIIYSIFFYSFIPNNFTRKILKYGVVLFVLYSIIYLITTKSLFISVSAPTYILGSFFLLLIVLIYFIEVLKSEEILNFKRTLPFYIAIGALVFHLTVTPLFIYLKFYRSKNASFVEIYQIILTAANIFMYTCYTLGFIICSQYKKISQEKRSY